jgi:GntR family transcriptional regulator, transcriptional repressor for pyruvate dehydrogenase complex
MTRFRLSPGQVEQMAGDDNSLYKPLPTRRAFQEIADQISNLIYSGKLNPGDRLPPERELSVHFGAGRMAVREAFRVLEQAGLIYIKQGVDGGAYVRDVDISVVSDSMTSLIRRANIKLDDFIAVRIGLEKLIVEAAIDNVTDYELENLRKNIEETEVIMAIYDRGDQPSDSTSLVQVGADFHLELARASKNPLLEILQESLVKVMPIFMTKRKYDRQFHQDHLALHKAIYEALKERNLSLTVELFKEHSLHMQVYLAGKTT